MAIEVTTDLHPAAVTPAHEQTTGDDLVMDGLFQQALQEDSNLEMDWLWLATKVSSIAQRRYALERALHINPRSAAAKRGIKQLCRRPDQPLELF